ncbi:MAG TPA: hypothetical protein VF173_08990 [Thermoanaerobaculia bacterium]|nr:hypothetical protein [Thermoanaerobaculia bacterium]
MSKEKTAKSSRAILTVSLLLFIALLTAPAFAFQEAPGTRPKTPVIEPGGSVTVEPGALQSFQTSAEGADKFEWKLQGKGSLSDSNSRAVLYTAPGEGGTLAILTVVARNRAGESSSAPVTIRVRTRAAYSLDALAIPAGWMSGKKDHPDTYIHLNAGSDCHQGSQCQQFAYTTGGGWGGIYWWPLDCGSSGTDDAWKSFRTGACAIDLKHATGMDEVRSLSFWARGAHGGEVIEFRVGGPDILPKPGHSTGRITLSSAWEHHVIDLAGLDLSHSAGLFLWTATDLANSGGAVFFLDNVQFEGFK